MNVDNAPFLVTKLKIQVLPCVIAFVDGVGADRIVGFEGLGGGELNDGDGFRAKDLEARLLAAGVLIGEKKLTEAVLVSGRASGKKKDDDDGGDDWD